MQMTNIRVKLDNCEILRFWVSPEQRAQLNRNNIPYEVLGWITPFCNHDRFITYKGDNFIQVFFTKLIHAIK